MKRIITVSLIMCILLLSLSSCAHYKNVTFIEGGDGRISYKDSEYYEAHIFSATEYYGEVNENDVELGEYYSFPFSTRFYSDESESPIYIYSIGGKTSFYLIESYDYTTDIFNIENTDDSIVWNDIFASKQSDTELSSQIRLRLYSEKYPKIQTTIDVQLIENQWYLCVRNSDEVWTASDEFVAILSENGII